MNRSFDKLRKIRRNGIKRSSRKTLFETQRIRLKRHSGELSRDLITGFALTGITGLTSVLMISMYLFSLDMPCFRLEKIVLNGCKKVTDKDILTTSGIRSNQSILTVNRGKVIRKIKTNPWIEDVSVRSELPDKLIIDVTERKAVALMRRDQTLYLVDANACPFKKLDDNENAELPILTGFSENGTDKADLIRKSLDLLDLLSKNDVYPKIEHISEIHVDENSGFSVFMDNGIRIRFGFGNYAEKLKRLKPVMADLARKANGVSLFFIDLNNPARVTVQIENAPMFPKFSKGYRT